MKKYIPEKKRRYYDWKKPVFETKHIESGFESLFKLEKFTTEKFTGIGYILLFQHDDGYYTIEGQKIEAFRKVKRTNAGFVDVDGTPYYKDNERSITLQGSYYHGFHYFRSKEEATYIREYVFRTFPVIVAQVAVTNMTASGTMFHIDTFVTTEIVVIK